MSDNEITTTAGRRKIKQMEVMVAEVLHETPDTTTLVLFTGNDKLDYKPGHFLTVDPHDFPALDRFTAYLEDCKGRREPPRAYSLSSAPHEKYLSITVKEERYVSGQTTYPPLLSPLLVYRTGRGTRLTVTGFTGPYVMPEDIEARTDTLLHLCAGSGVVPNFSIIKWALATGMKLKHIVVLGNKTWADVIYRDAFATLQERHPGALQVHHALTRESEPGIFGGRSVHVGRVNAALLKKVIPDLSAVQVFACGPGITKFDRLAARDKGEEPKPRFLESALEALAQAGVNASQVHTESYG